MQKLLLPHLLCVCSYDATSTDLPHSHHSEAARLMCLASFDLTDLAPAASVNSGKQQLLYNEVLFPRRDTFRCVDVETLAC